MKTRPIGVTLVAAGMLVGGACVLGVAGYGLNHPPPAPVRSCMGMLCGFDWRPIVEILATLEVALAVGALATGAGLLARREWARRAAIGLAAVALVVGIAFAGRALQAVGVVMIGLIWSGTGGVLIGYLERPEVRARFVHGGRCDQAAG